MTTAMQVRRLVDGSELVRARSYGLGIELWAGVIISLATVAVSLLRVAL